MPDDPHGVDVRGRRCGYASLNYYHRICVEPDHHPLAVDAGIFRDDFRTSAVRRNRPRSAPYDFWGMGLPPESARPHRRSNDRQLARPTCISDALPQRVLAEHHAIEEPQRPDDLIQHRPRDPSRDQMKLEGVDIFQVEAIRRATKQRLNFDTALRYGSYGAGDSLRTIMPLIMWRQSASNSVTSCRKSWTAKTRDLSNKRRLLRPPLNCPL